MNKEYLKELVGRGELKEAFDAMLGYGKSQKAIAWYNTLLIQYNQFKQLEQGRLSGTLSAEESSLTGNRILSALLALIDKLPSDENGAIPDAPPVHEADKSRWPLWIVLGAALLLGLIFVNSKINFFTSEPEVRSSSSEGTIPSGKSGSSRTLHFPEGDEISFIFSTGNEINYRLLNGTLKNLGGGAQQVSFTIRCSARKGNGANFWDDTFRLELDEPGALLAPSSGLNEVVANNSFRDGTVSFVVNEPFSRMKIAVVNPWDKEDIRKLTIGLN